MKVREALSAAARSLAEASDTPRLDAELLMAHALGTERDQLLLQALDQEVPPGFPALVDRRRANEPIAYIVGKRHFWTLELEVGPGALIPRPDSETLLEAALDFFGKCGPSSILDLGTGPGTLLLAALDQWPEARGLGVDRSETALLYARRNAARLGLADRADFRRGDWADGLDEPVDLILCNPPYVEQGATLDAQVRGWEPAEALFAGADGLDEYRRLAPQIPQLLRPGGLACIEIGAGQEDMVGALFAAQGMAVRWRQDLAGRPRCLLATRL